MPQIALMGSAFSEDGRLYAYSLSSGGSGELAMLHSFWQHADEAANMTGFSS